MGQHLQKTVLFYGDELIAVQTVDTGDIFVPLSRLCDNLGIERKRQAQRIRDHEVLSRGFAALTIETSGGAQEAQCLRLDLIPLWLAGVNANRVAPDVKAKLVQYQAEAASVLWAAFRHDILPATEMQVETRSRSGAEIALEIATAIQHLAQQQLEIERSLDGVHGRMDGMARFLRDFADSTDRRLSSLELQLNPQATITEEQAAELALAVKVVGQELSGTDRKQNGYQLVYGELYRRYQVSSYKNLPRSKYEEVLAWLHQWHSELQTKREA